MQIPEESFLPSGELDSNRTGRFQVQSVVVVVGEDRSCVASRT